MTMTIEDVTAAGQVRVLALAAITLPDSETEKFADEAAQILNATPTVIRPLFTAYCDALTHLEAFGAESNSYRDQHFGYPTPSHDTIAQRLDGDAKAALAALVELAVEPAPVALSPEQIELYHAQKCCTHFDDHHLCCMCGDDPCEVAIEAAREWLAEQTTDPVCVSCGDRPLGCSRCADEDGTR